MAASGHLRPRADMPNSPSGRGRAAVGTVGACAAGRDQWARHPVVARCSTRPGGPRPAARGAGGVVTAVHRSPPAAAPVISCRPRSVTRPMQARNPAVARTSRSMVCARLGRCLIDGGCLLLVGGKPVNCGARARPDMGAAPTRWCPRTTGSAPANGRSAARGEPGTPLGKALVAGVRGLGECGLDLFSQAVPLRVLPAARVGEVHGSSATLRDCRTPQWTG